MIANQLTRFIDRLLLITLFTCLIPLLYLIFTNYSYGYGITVIGLMVYFSPLFFILLLKIWSSKKLKKLKFSCPNFSKMQTEIYPKFNLKFPVFLTLLAIIGVSAYVYGAVIQRVGSISLFDTALLYRHFSSAGDAGNLSMIGKLGVILAPLVFVLFSYSFRYSGVKKLILATPIMILVFFCLLLGTRQISLFFVLFFISTLFYLFYSIRIISLLKIAFVSFLFLSIALYVGYQRSGWESFDTQISQNQHDVSDTPNAAIFGLLWGYIGSGPEYLSIITDKVKPFYMPFVTTNSFLLRRINSFTDYIDYEKDIVPKTSGVVEDTTGLFARSWAGGNLQLYIEGGYILILVWFLFLFQFWKYIVYRAFRGHSILLDVSFFGSIFLMHLFVFPLRDQLIFLSFLWYFLMLVSRHISFGRYKFYTSI